MKFWPSIFTASPSQVATYLFGVALFSISFLVFLNSSISFVVTDLIGQRHNVGDAVGTLGFADELVALVACPFWGLISDRLGVRYVAVIGYAIVGLSLSLFVRAHNVYPQLLLARLLFSVGGAATSTMVTAVLPTMTASSQHHEVTSISQDDEESSEDSTYGSDISDPDIRHDPQRPPLVFKHSSNTRSGTSQIAGLVGMFTGLGALLALAVFLPLPSRLQQIGITPRVAVVYSFFIVGAVAFAVAVFCTFGLRNLPGEEAKGWNNLLSRDQDSSSAQARPRPSYLRLGVNAAKLGLKDVSIALGYLGGFVARASSVGISLFIPLYVDAYFISHGKCSNPPDSPPSDIKNDCSRAYSIAAMLTGVSQLVALICAPVFGYMDGRFRRLNGPMLMAALAGVIGYITLAKTVNPDPKTSEKGLVILVIMALLGISQIGAIVCSLSVLGRGIQGAMEEEDDDDDDGTLASEDRTHPIPAADASDENSPLLAGVSTEGTRSSSRTHLKGSIAGLYSLFGGAGILLLTKLGGYLFDRVSVGAPFFMLATFNAILLVVAFGCGIRDEMKRGK